MKRGEQKLGVWQPIAAEVRPVRRKEAAILALTTAALAAPSRTSASVAFTNFGTLPGYDYACYASDVSGDGSVVVGTSVQRKSTGGSTSRAFRWTASGGMQDLGVFSGAEYSGAAAISRDGSAIGGSGGSANNNPATRWTQGTGMASIGSLPPVYPLGPNATAYGLSAGGGVVIGSCNSGQDQRAFRWTASTGMQPLASVDSSANAISADGTIVGGFRSGRAVIWTPAGVVDLGGSYSSFANAITPDGQVVAGGSNGIVNGSSRRQAFTWTVAGGMKLLGLLPGGHESYANGISDTGNAVVGQCAGNGFGWDAFLWTPELGMVNLNSYLPSLGVDLTGWTLDYCTGVSGDGSVLVGYGTFNGQDRGWVVTGIPAPGAGVLFVATAVALSARRRRV